MTSVPSPPEILDRLARLRFDHVFNPYADLCPDFDLPNAPAIRSANVLATFDAAATKGVDQIWVGLEPGHRGARRTGLAMTDDRNLPSHAARWGLPVIRQATFAGPDAEQTAGIVWDALATRAEVILLWNVFPLHSHPDGTSLGNRRHTRDEWIASRWILEAVIKMVAPGRIVAVGREAAAAISEVGLDCAVVRHPARGGRQAFLTGIETA